MKNCLLLQKQGLMIILFNHSEEKRRTLERKQEKWLGINRILLVIITVEQWYMLAQLDVNSFLPSFSMDTIIKLLFLACYFIQSSMASLLHASHHLFPSPSETMLCFHSLPALGQGPYYSVPQIVNFICSNLVQAWRGQKTWQVLWEATVRFLCSLPSQLCHAGFLTGYFVFS